MRWDPIVQRIGFANRDKHVVVWRREESIDVLSADVEGKDGARIVHTDRAKDMEVSSQHPIMAVSTGGDRMSLLDLETGTTLQSFASAQKAQFTPDGLGLLVIDSGGRPSIWEFQSTEKASIGEPFALTPGGPLGQFFHVGNIECPPVVRPLLPHSLVPNPAPCHTRIRHWGTTFQSLPTASWAAMVTLPWPSRRKSGQYTYGVWRPGRL